MFALASKNLGTGGYIVSRETAIKLLNTIQASTTLIPIDHFIFDVMRSEVCIYQLSPALCIQDHKLIKSHQNFPSVLEKERRERKQTVRPSGETKKNVAR